MCPWHFSCSDVNSSSFSLRVNSLKLLRSCENIYLEASDVLRAVYYEELFAAMLRASLLFSSWEDNINMYRKEMACQDDDTIHQEQQKGQCSASKNFDTKVFAQ